MINFEHKACLCQRLRGQRIYRQMASNLLDIVGIDPALRDSRGELSYIFTQYAGDATHQDAILKSKMHVSSLLTVASLADGTVSVVKAVPDLKAMTYGTGEELYRIILSEFTSVHCPNWLAAKADAVDAMTLRRAPVSVHHFSFDLDKGPENQWFGRVMVADLENVSPVIASVEWCFLHMVQRIGVT